MRTRILSITAAFVVALVLGVGVAPASAALPVPPPAPSPTARFGIAWSDLFVTDTPVFQDVGGWINPPVYYGTGAAWTNGVKPAVVTPVVWRIGEPFLTADGHLKVPYSGYYLQDDRAGAVQGDGVITGAAIPGEGSAGAPVGRVRCSNSPWAEQADTTTYDLGGTRDDSPNLGVLSHTAIAVQGYYFSMPYNCPYLVELTMSVGFYVAGIQAMQFTQIAWLAGNYIVSTPYVGTNTDSSNVKLCQWADGAAVSPAKCLEYLPKDPGSFASMCAGAPVASWLTWDWLGPWIAFYSQCMFIPTGGFDRMSWISSAWSHGSPGAVSAAFARIGNSMSIEESCGPLTPPGTGQWRSFNLNTCSWTWAGGMKTFIGWVGGLMAAWWLFGFVVASIVGVTNKKTVSPLGDDKP